MPIDCAFSLQMCMVQRDVANKYITAYRHLRTLFLLGAALRQGRPQSSARGCTCTPLDFGFQLFLQNNMQSLTQRHHQTLSYRVKVKYDSRCWYSTSRHALYRYALLPLTSLWVCTPTGKIQWAPMTLPRLFKVFLGLAPCHYCKLIIRPFYNLSIDIGQGRPHVFCFSWHSIV